MKDRRKPIQGSREEGIFRMEGGGYGVEGRRDFYPTMEEDWTIWRKGWYRTKKGQPKRKKTDQD